MNVILLRLRFAGACAFAAAQPHLQAALAAAVHAFTDGLLQSTRTIADSEAPPSEPYPDADGDAQPEPDAEHPDAGGSFDAAAEAVTEADPENGPSGFAPNDFTS